MNNSDVAAILKTGILLKYFSSETITEWADCLINNGEINEFVIELSLSKSKSIGEVIGLLDSLISSNDSENLAKHFFLNYFKGKYERSVISPLQLQRELIDFYNLNAFYFSDTEKISFSILLNDYSLREAGYDGQNNINKLLKDLFNNYHHFDYPTISTNCTEGIMRTLSLNSN
jgi:hypothetical protein